MKVFRKNSKKEWEYVSHDAKVSTGLSVHEKIIESFVNRALINVGDTVLIMNGNKIWEYKVKPPEPSTCIVQSVAVPW